MTFGPYIKLMRPRHWLKNGLIFLPLIFSGDLFKGQFFVKSIMSFVVFSLVASAVYIFNDLNDRERDALHPTKKDRPLASGSVSPFSAALLAVFLLVVAGVLQYFTNPIAIAYGLLAFYIVINIAYSLGLKNVPVLDVAILSVGYIIRVFYGGASIGIEISKWLYLAVLAFSFYLGLGKRRNEIRSHGTKTRKVSQFYTQGFLDKNMYVCLGLTVAYYSLWAIDPSQKHPEVFWTIPVVIVIVMAYSLAIEGSESDGDPVNVVFNNKLILGLLAFYGILMTGLLYIHP